MFSSFPVVILPHYCLIWSMYLCVWVGGGKHASYSCMHSTLCVASWQNVGHHRTITCTNITKILLITISLCVCPSFLSHCVSAPRSLYLSVPFIFVLCASFTLIIRACVGKYPWAFFYFTPLPLTCILFVFTPFFLFPLTSLFRVRSGIIDILVLSPSLI